MANYVTRCDKVRERRMNDWGQEADGSRKRRPILRKIPGYGRREYESVSRKTNLQAFIYVLGRMVTMVSEQTRTCATQDDGCNRLIQQNIT